MIILHALFLYGVVGLLVAGARLPTTIQRAPLYRRWMRSEVEGAEVFSDRFLESFAIAGLTFWTTVLWYKTLFLRLVTGDWDQERLIKEAKE